MSDAIPDNSHFVAHVIGLIFHPAVLVVPTLLLVLRDLPPTQALVWTSLIASIIMIPGFSLIAYLRRRDQHVYQRHTRLPIYISGWLSVLVCLVLILVFGGPHELALSMGMLAVWLPLQMAVNHYVTKISAHTAIAAGCFMGVLVMGKVSAALIPVGVIIIALVAWARIVTKNHTLLQVSLGVLVGAGSALAVYPILA